MANPHDEIREMGLRSRDASLSRVEAAAKAVAEMAWFDPARWSYAALETIAEVALAAADACEAERNPNTTDEYEAVAGWRIGRQADSEAHRESGYCYVARCGFVFRRAVSSEDVHREE